MDSPTPFAADLTLPTLDGVGTGTPSPKGMLRFTPRRGKRCDLPMLAMVEKQSELKRLAAEISIGLQRNSHN